MARNYLTDPNISRRTRRQRDANNRRTARLSSVERSAVLAGRAGELNRGDSLDDFFRSRLLAIECRADQQVQRVLDARRKAARDTGSGCLITEDVLTARGNSGNGCVNSAQIKQPIRGEVDDVNRLLDDPRVARFSMA